ncbi:hypothetical protein MMC12_004847 [Toensbergia leucococca]|nr:hypothetical protein [Toensbergia leucococca]
MLRRRPVAAILPPPPMEAAAEPLLPSAIPPAQKAMTAPKSPWLLFAIASGACAAFNGVFAKLYAIGPPPPPPQFPQNIAQLRPTKTSTTTELTSSWASAISTALSLSPQNRVVEFLIRAVKSPPNPVPNNKPSAHKRADNASRDRPDLLLPKSRLQRPHVGPLHHGPNARNLHHARLHHQHILQFHVDGVAGAGDLPGELAAVVVAWGGGAGGWECGYWEEGGGGREEGRGWRGGGGV